MMGRTSGLVGISESFNDPIAPGREPVSMARKINRAVGQVGREERCDPGDKC